MHITNDFIDFLMIHVIFRYSCPFYPINYLFEENLIYDNKIIYKKSIKSDSTLTVSDLKYLKLNTPLL